MSITAASYRRALLCGTVLATALSAASASAQAAYPPEPAEDDGEVIVVTGSIRESQEAAIATKRRADNLVDVASADSVGRFPDENTAAALARLPGVAVQRDQGQARYIQVRGAPNRWTSVSIDGIPQTGVDEGGDSRSYRFDAVPAVLLQQLVVNKSLTPDITAEAITANVDLRTYSPLSDRGLSISGDLGYGFMDLGDGQQRQGSLRVSWSNDTIGAAVGASHYLRDQVTDNREAGYDEFGPTDIDIRNYELERSNNGLFAVVEAMPTDGLKLYVRGIYTEFTDKEHRNAYQIELADAESGTRGMTSGELVGVPVTAAFNNGLYENQNYIGSAGFEYESMDGWGLDGAFGYTRTENSTDLPLVQGSTSGTASPSVIYDRSGDPRFPLVTLYETVDDGNGNLSRGDQLAGLDQTAFDWPRSILLPLVQETVSDAWTGKVDGWREFGNVTLKAGGLVSIREIEGNNLGVGGVVPLGPLGFDFTQYLTNRPWDTRFPLGITFDYMDNVALNDALQIALDEAGIDAADFIPPSALYDQKETILAGYAMGQFDLDRLFVTAGVRVENYEIENRGTALIDRTATPLSVTEDHFDIFPSVNARFDVTDNLVFRLSGQRGVSRPAYAAIRVGASISDTGETISGGNPQLLPEYTWGVDGSLEYYFPSNGIASVSGFYRWVDNVLYQSQQVVGSDIYNTGGIDRSGYMLGSTFNGDNGKLYGVEFNIEHQLDFLPGLLSGFGVQGNLTLLGGEFDALLPDGTIEQTAFQGLSDTVLNASVFYEHSGLSARVSYQWRSEYLDTLGGLGAGEYRDGYENLDITLRYSLTDNFTLFADLANLTNETYVAYEGTPATPSEVEQIGSRYLFGIRFDF
ncbi:TonB-dependent receptor [Pelagerythrobacter marensis]|uniref:TonB-dependent receptor n=1 Tax=Pelagerythrobacter marensis TaxID=543877 RepID=A0ABZ2D3H7_9SPHN